MDSYHINSKGQAVACYEAMACPFGDSQVHYKSATEALDAHAVTAVPKLSPAAAAAVTRNSLFLSCQGLATAMPKGVLEPQTYLKYATSAWAKTRDHFAHELAFLEKRQAELDAKDRKAMLKKDREKLRIDEITLHSQLMGARWALAVVERAVELSAPRTALGHKLAPGQALFPAYYAADGTFLNFAPQKKRQRRSHRAVKGLAVADATIVCKLTDPRKSPGRVRAGIAVA